MDNFKINPSVDEDKLARFEDFVKLLKTYFRPFYAKFRLYVTYNKVHICYKDQSVQDGLQKCAQFVLRIATNS